MEALINRHYASSLKLACSILRNRTEAEDSVQSAFLQVVRNLDRYEERSEFRTWLVRIVLNQCLMSLRRRRRAPLPLEPAWNANTSEDLPPSGPLVTCRAPEPGPEERARVHQLSSIVRRAVGGLPAAYRKAILLYHLEEEPVEAVAEEMNISGGALKSRLKRGRAQLRMRLGFAM
jgi:RNA polymerase sigma-70 factor (ECF subfamily)